MLTEFTLSILTEDGCVFEGPVDSIVVPGVDGYFGVQAHHAPLLAALGRGRLTVYARAAVHDYAVSGGFMEVAHNRATLLAHEIHEVAS